VPTEPKATKTTSEAAPALAKRSAFAGLRERLRTSGALRLGAIVFVYLMIASAAFSGFYDKWGLRDGDERYSLVQMLDGDAHRPFVYRQFLPTLANGFDTLLSASLEERVVQKLRTPVWWEANGLEQRMRVDFDAERDYVVRYYFVYYACIGFLFLALLVMREIGLELGLSELASTLAPALFGLTTVYYFSMGGFFYDFPELFFMASAFLLVLRNRLFWLVPLTVLATWNKEAFLFFALTLFPLFLRRHTLMRAAAITQGLAFIAGVTYLIARAPFLDNPGNTSESWLIPSLRFYIDPRNLFAFETNYGMVTPRGYSLFTIAVVALLFAGAWRAFDKHLRRHALLAAGVTVPLVLLFAGPGEVRNYSFCFIALMLAMAFNLEQWAANAKPATVRSGA